MHTIKLLLTYYLNISVQAANLSDCRIESNRKIDSVAIIESNRIETFLPELECSSVRHCDAASIYQVHVYYRPVGILFVYFLRRKCMLWKKTSMFCCIIQIVAYINLLIVKPKLPLNKHSNKNIVTRAC